MPTRRNTPGLRVVTQATEAPSRDDRKASLRNRALTVVARNVAGGMDIRDAIVRAACDAKAEALAAGWTIELANSLGVFVARVGAEWAADLVAEVAAQKRTR